ncbi:CAF17-like 4Fe-4S cluster assembly/insertion protein YgfZ [Oscillatoria sp. FACHB-1407]|uniref:CAF17-like 4Fe-4S cluster assembly/insertion protein YgfZ n=1 Tax=Oscillatoria sp. FACHB-1407 TaxID=2692847 RepID=UPI0018EF8B88
MGMVDGGANGVTATNDTAAREAVRSGVAVGDRSHWGRLQVSDADRLRYLHNQTTNNFNSLQPGQGCDTVFVTSTGRTIDLVTAYVTDNAVLLLVSPNRRTYLMEWMDRFIFFADKVAIKDLTDSTATFSLLGTRSDALLEKLGAGDMVGKPYASHAIYSINGIEARVAVGSGLTTPGYTLLTSATDAPALWQVLTEMGVVPMSNTLWEQLRIEQGRPLPDHELTEDFNPLEAGLWHTISLSKGCYIGQETIARLHTYRGVKQQLWGVRLSAPAETGSAIMAGDEKVGVLTSCTNTDQGIIGLAYIRTKAVAPDLKVQIGSSQGELVSLPFVSHEYL